MKVLFAIHFPIFGGPHNQALRLEPALAARGWETVALLPDGAGNAAVRLREGNVDVVTMPLHRLRASPNPRLHVDLLKELRPEVQAIRRIIRDRGIDVVQVGGLVNPHAAIAARLESVPVVWQLLDTRAPLPLAVASVALVKALSDVVMSTGRRVLLAHPGGYGLIDRTVEFFPPVDVNLFRPRPELRTEVRSEWGIDPDSRVVGCVANLNPQKGIVALVEAFGSVRRRMPDACLVIVGAEYATQAGYSAKVRRAIHDAGLALGRDVILVGDRADVERQLAALDVFAFAPANRSEGISTSVLEAMAVGLPVVTTDVAGLGEAIDSGSDGLLVPPGDVPALANAIHRVLADLSTSRRLGQAARSRAVASFSVDVCADRHVEAFERATGRFARRRLPTRSAAVRVQDVVRCPACRGAISTQAGTMSCDACGSVYPIDDGIPVLLRDASLAHHDEIDHMPNGQHADRHKADQAAHFDRSDMEEFEVTRPHGTPRLYRFLLREKFRRATEAIGARLQGKIALTVCGGSGIDAEYLANAGATVVSTDISLGAARRTLARARRYGLEVTAIVADAENLPFRDASFDLVFVHDGLHHLEEPTLALDEMARVSRRWVSVTEPTRAWATAAAVRLGIAVDREEAGNPVIRMTPADVTGALRRGGFRTLAARRYAMFYKHKPGRIFRALSRPLVFPVARMSWRLGNAVIGRAGNKMVIVAERELPRDMLAVSDH